MPELLKVLIVAAGKTFGSIDVLKLLSSKYFEEGFELFCFFYERPNTFFVENWNVFELLGNVHAFIVKVAKVFAVLTLNWTYELNLQCFYFEK